MRRMMMVAPPIAGAAGGTFSHKYWRLAMAQDTIVSGSWTPTAAAMTALSFKDDGGSVISTSGATAIESDHSGSQDASKLYDGIGSTYWKSTTGDEGWVGIQFATAQKVRQIGIQVETSANMGGTSQPKAAFLQCSDDGVAWQMVAHLEIPTLTVNTLTWFDFTGCLIAAGAADYGSHTYWRMLSWMSAASPAGWTALSALRFKDDTGSVIATTGGTALESGHFSTFASSALFDSSDPTFWESTQLYARNWAGYQFASAQKVMQFGLQRTASMDGSNPPETFLAEFSDNGTCWGVAALVEVTTALTNDVTTWYNLAGALPVSSTTDFGSHAYWRAQAWLYGFVAWSAIVHKDDTGTLVATTGGSSSSRAHSSSFVDANAYDAVASTFYESGVGTEPNQWTSYHFSSAKKIMQMGVQQHATTMDGTPVPRRIFWIWSDDGIIWSPLAIQVNVYASTASTDLTNDVPRYFNFTGALRT